MNRRKLVEQNDKIYEDEVEKRNWPIGAYNYEVRRFILNEILKIIQRESEDMLFMQ